VSDQPYQEQRLANIIPGILRDVGDMQHIAALISPRELTLRAPVSPQGQALDATAAAAAFSNLPVAWQSQPQRLTITADPAGK
jgi:hypothetical protein